MFGLPQTYHKIEAHISATTRGESPVVSPHKMAVMRETSSCHLIADWSSMVIFDINTDGEHTSKEVECKRWIYTPCVLTISTYIGLIVPRDYIV